MVSTIKQTAAEVYIVDAARTPFIKAQAVPGPFSAADLALAAGRALLLRHACKATDLDQVILGCVIPDATEANIARQVALRLGCGHAVPAWTVQRNCASGLQALDAAAQAIASGSSDLILAGGTEAMSHAPLLFSKAAQNWFGRWTQAQRRGGRLACLRQFRPAFLSPSIALKLGLTDPLVNMSMPETAEAVANLFAIQREQADAYALQSQQRALAAQQAGHFTADIVPLLTPQAEIIEQDQGIRADSSQASLARLTPVVNRRFGQVTAGNSSQITDGAALILLASAEAVERFGLPVLGRIVDVQWAGVDPKIMGIGPVAASMQLLTRYQMSLDDIACWELNEAFAAQVLACVAAFDDSHFCQQQGFAAGPYGQIPMDRLNVDGGAIALGHPIGASGARIVMQLMRTLQRQAGRYGVATLCIGGGQGGAILVESMQPA